MSSSPPDVDAYEVTEVLLPDGWYAVNPQSFVVGPSEFLPGKYPDVPRRYDIEWNPDTAAGSPGIDSIAFAFLTTPDGYGNCLRITGPRSTILAVKEAV